MNTFFLNDVSRVEPYSISLPMNSSKEVLIQYGIVRLLRSKRCKNNLFFAPFIPSSNVLLLFPEGVDVSTGAVRLSAHADLVRFLSALAETSGALFDIAEAAACLHSGSLLFVLKCADVEDALHVASVAEDSVRQSAETLWSLSSLYVHAMICEPFEKVMSSLANGYTELLLKYYYFPVCPLCADRLDKTVSGYSFPDACRCSETKSRCACVQASSCKVCQLFASTLTGKEQTSKTATRCFTCGRLEDPWVCLICGYIGCSRYQAMHAKEHFVAEGHCFSMNLLTQEVWDYESDRFVHHWVLCIDSSTGDTSRIQYPEREEMESPVEVLKESLEKKCISTKFDSQLSTTHTQYSIMIKNELDASREQLELDVVFRLAYQNASEEVEEAQRSHDVVERNSHNPPLDHPIKESILELQLLEAQCVAATQETAQQNALADELELQYNIATEEWRQKIQRNVKENLTLEQEIAELRMTLQEIKANFSAAAAVNHRVGSHDGWSAFMAVSDGVKGQSTRKKRR